MAAPPVCSCSYPSSPVRPFKELRGLQRGRGLPGWRRRENRRVLRAWALAGPEHLHGLADLAGPFMDHVTGPLMDHLFLAYERVVYPCQNMNCGDVLYRR